MLSRLGWPETLQHGDLWITNLLVARTESTWVVRLIDWDYSGIGIPIYDLSRFLRQFPASDRPWILDAYRNRVESEGWGWPGEAALNDAAETCELGRYANSIVWRTLSALQLHYEATPGHSFVPPQWIFDDLLEIEQWFRDLTPLLPTPEETSSGAAA